MFQTFESATRPEQGPPRLKALRAAMAGAGVDGFIVPRADAWQGEYVAPCDERLAWLTGFTGSAGYCVALGHVAGVFVDGRYRVQVKQQVADVFTPVDWPETSLGDWIADQGAEGAVIGFDPWLHPPKQVEALRARLARAGMTLQAVENLVDAIWEHRPARPDGRAFAHPIELSGERSPAKRARIAQSLRDAGEDAAILTLPDSICWLLNIRGADIPRIPILQCFAILHSDGRVGLFVEPEKVADLGPDPEIDVAPPAAFLPAVKALAGRVRVDAESCPQAVVDALTAEVVMGTDPCLLPKARKNPVELSGARAAHQRDAVAMVEFLAWLDAQAPGTLSEIDVAQALEGFRRGTNALQDISFETISGAGAHGAIVHYRVTEETNRRLADGELYLVDSGGQYVDGTTDITRTVTIGEPPEGARAAFTRVLQGMIGLSRLRFPRGIAGGHIDAIARAPLWMAGQDYDHGTGHGVGSYLSVHEGPARISRVSLLPLEPGMILSNEPGYYREGEFGIRIENLIVVEEARPLPGADARDMLSFETLTYVPIDRRLIVSDMLSAGERDWLNAYHADCAARVAGQLSDRAAAWIAVATAAI
ncbi:MAG: aminopeptidase P family protein [Pseudomonadota bacterium]